jgi:hypothetical protein
VFDHIHGIAVGSELSLMDVPCCAASHRTAEPAAAVKILVLCSTVVAAGVIECCRDDPDRAVGKSPGARLAY